MTFLVRTILRQSLAQFLHKASFSARAPAHATVRKRNRIRDTPSGPSSRQNKPESNSISNRFSSNPRARKHGIKPHRPEQPQRLVIPHAGLSAHQVSLLTNQPANVVLRTARELEPSLELKPDAQLTPPLVELVIEALEAPFIVSHQLLSLARRAQGKRGNPDGASTNISKQQLPIRVPVVTIMGHVDVGKTTLLDALRNTNLAKHELGGITQSIGAFSVTLSGPGISETDGKTVTFIDTPGHEAFSAMRAHGADATDIAVIVVAADDGIMPQTLEAIALAKSANVPIVIAINKCDKEGSDPNRARVQLLELADVNCEQLGGDVQCVDISAKTGHNVQSLIEAILLQSELLDLRSDPTARASGVCLESRSDRQIGNVASLIVKSGTLRVGDHVAYSSLTARSGELHGRIRIMHNTNGESIKSAHSGTAVAVSGLKVSILPGAEFAVFDSEREARAVAEEILLRNTDAAATCARIADIERSIAADDETVPTSTSVLYQTSTLSERAVQESGITAISGPSQNEGTIGNESSADGSNPNVVDCAPVLNVVVKSDVQGAADAVSQCIMRQATDECSIRILHVGIGDITDNDVMLGSAIKALKGNLDHCLIVAFNVRVSAKVVNLARGKIDVLSHGLIYKLEEDIALRVQEIVKAWRPQITVVGAAGVVKAFENGKIAGCIVQEGNLKIGTRCRVLRFLADGGGGARENVFESTISSLKQFSKDVRSVPKGAECGVSLQDWSSFSAGDLLECFVSEQSKTKGK